MQVTIFKDLFKSTDVPFIVPIDKIIDRIKNGASKDTINKIRLSKDKDERDRLKKKLPAVLFAGKFSERNKNGLEKHSGLMVTDFDKFPNDEVYQEMFNKIIANKYVAIAFKGPSGDGIKAVVRIPESDKITHEKYFKSFKDEFNFEYFDQSNCDVSRVCFESYDPNIYVNLEAEVYSPELIDDGYSVKEYISYTPLDDENKIIDLIMSFNWKKDFVEGERNNFIFDVAGAFCEYGVSESTAIGYIQNNIVHGSFSEQETITTVKNVYRKRQFGVRFFEDYEKKQKLEIDVKTKAKDDIKKEYNINDEQYEEIKDKATQEDFWYVEIDKKGKSKLKVDPYKYKQFLESSGFKKFFHNDSQKPTWVKIKSNKVSETSVEKIKDYVLDYLLRKKENNVWRYCVNYQTLFSENFLLMLDTVELMMLKDNKTKSFIAYDNGILEVTKNNIRVIDYIDVDGYIWDSQIIKREFIKSKEDNDYKSFINKISNYKPEAIECVIGYLLSTYKNKMNNKAIILNDEVISDNPEGGTGKGLFVQGIRQIRNVSILDGKTFDDKKSFPYQTVSQDTQILVFDDVKKNWDFESKFSLVTEGMTLERKNKDAIKLTVEESPKMVVSTNYAIKGEGNSHDRRRHEIEISQFYSGKFTPYDDFKRQMFDDWSIEDFNRFDNYMVYCLQLYLNKGLVKQDAKNINLRKFIAETSMEFKEWIEDTDNFKLNNHISKVESFNNFINEYPDYKKWLTRKRFNIWVQKYASFINADFKQGNSNGSRWFMIDNGIKIEDEYNGIDF